MTYENIENDSKLSADQKVVLCYPKVYMVGRQSMDEQALAAFLEDEGYSWQTDTEVGGEKLVEASGRMCYMSYGAGRKTNKTYINNILAAGHGSVLEHAQWNFMITGVSRSFTHELVRHRAGFAYSQLSQRYVDESQCRFVIPECIKSDPKLCELWTEAVDTSLKAYGKLVTGLSEKFADVPEATLRRKMARQAARSVLPNATETKIFVSANARALRHFIEMRCNEHAEVEIRSVAAQILEIMQSEAPNIFGDYKWKELPDGSRAAETVNPKV